MNEISFTRARIDLYGERRTKASYPLSRQVRIEAENLGNKIRVTFTRAGQHVVSKEFKIDELPWAACNPYRLSFLAGPPTLEKDILRAWAALDKQTSLPLTCLEPLRQAMLFINESEIPQTIAR